MISVTFVADAASFDMFYANGGKFEEISQDIFQWELFQETYNTVESSDVGLAVGSEAFFCNGIDIICINLLAYIENRAVEVFEIGFHVTSTFIFTLILIGDRNVPILILFRKEVDPNILVMVSVV